MEEAGNEETKVEEENIVGPFDKLKSDNLQKITHASGKVKFNRLAQKEVEEDSGDEEDGKIGFQTNCENGVFEESKVSEE